MRVNEGIIDRLVRIAIAIGIIVAFLAGKLPGHGALLLVFSGSLFMSSATGFCPFYNPLGINTCKK